MLPLSVPPREIEATLWTTGQTRIAGVDEAGRGCLAGPVVAGAVVLPPGLRIEGVQDSKVLSPAQRERALRHILSEAVAVGIGLCTPEEIDQLNILHAAMEAMRRAVEALDSPVDAVLVDGNRLFPDPPAPAQAIVKGDRHVHAIAAASVVAKVTRDRMMLQLDSV
ncbi:MAG: ribonuclease HII, partial [Bacteroidota bacterium]